MAAEQRNKCLNNILDHATLATNIVHFNLPRLARLNKSHTRRTDSISEDPTFFFRYFNILQKLGPEPFPDAFLMACG